MWWPSGRSLAEALPDLFDQWPEDGSRIVRVLFSPPDWDDRPRSVPIRGGRVKTGCFPMDDTRTLVVTTLEGRRYHLRVVPPDASPAEAAASMTTSAV
ncbi:DUF5994 family protein [Nocardioides sp. BSK12Z-4]|uniref:DUF5994 family protein n=1 Tax=Nocardioides bruguierae TaxID=2945102 RepID=A0A9X2IDQ9_9ACTN|nr:DUF5994 family protein [Nocardioides bruguierae]MCM0619283.1 DUF5994 family protein [Nocardioides bruguierae]